MKTGKSILIKRSFVRLEKYNSLRVRQIKENEKKKEKERTEEEKQKIDRILYFQITRFASSRMIMRIGTSLKPIKARTQRGIRKTSLIGSAPVTRTMCLSIKRLMPFINFRNHAP